MNDVRPSDLRLSDLRLSDLGLSNLRGWYALMVATGLVLVTGCGGGGSKPNVITTSGPNVAAISVNRGPTGNDVNEAFVSVTICVPNTSTCQTIPDVIVDTGSAGLRLTAPLTISLPQQMGSNSHPVAECLPFLSGFSWGPVQTADIKIASETASAVPVQVMSDAAFPVPGACSNMGLQPIDTVAALGANGLLGVGLANQDCGPACAPGTTSNPNLYYECPTTGCVATTEALAQQVANPVATFASDNNGVVIELPAVNGGDVLDMNWLPWPVLPKKRWPAVSSRETRHHPERTSGHCGASSKTRSAGRFTNSPWHLGASQIDIAFGTGKC